MQRLRLVAFAALAMSVVLASACGDGNFSGSGRKLGPTTVRTGGEAQAAAGGEASTTKASDANPSAASSGDDAAINKCLAAWGTASPFAASKPSYRTIHASVQVLGVGKGLVDDVHTDKPELVLVAAAVSVLGKSTYQLLNPNGWYCVKADVNVLTGVSIELACAAHMADSKVDVGILSNAQAVGQVGVHVLSDVSISRVGGSCQ